MVDFDLLWLAGFLEGEGSFNLFIIKQRWPVLSISFHTTDQDVAEKAATLLGTKAKGPCLPHRNSLGKLPYWAVNRTGEAAARIMQEVLPYMGKRRTLKIQEALLAWHNRPAKHREHGLPPTCHPERKHYSRGLCRPCHFKRFRYTINKMNKSEIVAAFQIPICASVKRDFIFVSSKI